MTPAPELFSIDDTVPVVRPHVGSRPPGGVLGPHGHAVAALRSQVPQSFPSPGRARGLSPRGLLPAALTQEALVRRASAAYGPGGRGGGDAARGNVAPTGPIGSPVPRRLPPPLAADLATSVWSVPRPPSPSLLDHYGVGLRGLAAGVRRSDPGCASALDRTATRIAVASRFGVLGPYLLLDDVTDIVVTGSSGAWVDRGEGFVRVPEWRPTPEEVRAVAVRLIAEGGRHIDEVTPFVDVRLAGGIRVHAVLPPLSLGGAALSIRIPSITPLDLAALGERGMFDTPAGSLAAVLTEAVSRRTNILITGGTGTGKTTLLAALLSGADPRERIICIEDVAELVIAHPHVVSLEARQPNIEGTGGVDIARLLRESLRMRPDRLVLGECRGVELRDMLSALNTGHDGGASTVHANSLDDVPARLEALGSLAGMTANIVARQAVSAIGLIVHLERADGRRRVSALGRFACDPDGQLVVARGSAA